MTPEAAAPFTRTETQELVVPRSIPMEVFDAEAAASSFLSMLASFSSVGPQNRSRVSREKRRSLEDALLAARFAF